MKEISIDFLEKDEKLATYEVKESNGKLIVTYETEPKFESEFEPKGAWCDCRQR